MKLRNLLSVTLALVFTVIFFSNCSTTQDVPSVEKSGTELWAENCSRCHNAPPPSAFESEEWDVIGLHMRMRTFLTQAEVKKIEDFLKREE